MRAKELARASVRAHRGYVSNECVVVEAWWNPAVKRLKAPKAELAVAVTSGPYGCLRSGRHVRRASWVRDGASSESDPPTVSRFEVSGTAPTPASCLTPESMISTVMRVAGVKDKD